MNNSRSFVRKAILEMNEPFHLEDLYDRLLKQDVTDKGLVLQVMEELYQETLVDYIHLYDSTYAFSVV